MHEDFTRTANLLRQKRRHDAPRAKTLYTFTPPHPQYQYLVTQGRASAFFLLGSRGTLSGGRQPLYSEAGVFSLQTTHFPQHRLGLPPQDPAFVRTKQFQRSKPFSLLARRIFGVQKRFHALLGVFSAFKSAFVAPLGVFWRSKVFSLPPRSDFTFQKFFCAPPEAILGFKSVFVAPLGVFSPFKSGFNSIQTKIIIQ